MERQDQARGINGDLTTLGNSGCLSTTHQGFCHMPRCKAWGIDSVALKELGMAFDRRGASTMCAGWNR